MHSTMTKRVRGRTLHALGEYGSFTLPDLLTEIAELHHDLDAAEHGGFSPAARHGVREVIIRQLLAVDRECRRRQRPDELEAA